MEIRSFLGIAASLIGLIGYIPYVRDIRSGRTRPHIFSWFIWAIMESIACAAILTGGGFAGSWAHAVTAAICVYVVILSLKNGEKQITLVDKICLTLSLIAIALWKSTSNPLYAVILVVIADGLAYIPTFRKAFYRPQEETLITFVLNAIKQVLVLCSMSAYSPTTVLFDAYLISANTAFVSMLIIRRRQLKRQI